MTEVRVSIRPSHTCTEHVDLNDTRVSLGMQPSITQEFSLNNDVMALVVYELERRASASSPAAELTGFQNYRPGDRLAVTRPTDFVPFPYPTAYGLQPHSQLLRFRRIDQTSPSCAPAPVNDKLPALAASMLF